jgi:RNA methyltransferase, TrmH family
MYAASSPSEPAPGTLAPSSTPAILISSRQNPLVKRLRRLHSPAGRREQGLLLLEGTHLAQEVLGQGHPISELVATPAWWQRHGSLAQGLAALAGPAGRTSLVSEAVLCAIATTEHPDGVVLTLPPPRWPSPQQLRYGLLLDGVQDPGNLGTLLRTALAAGVEQVWLADGADPLQPKVLRASAGAALALAQQRLPREQLRLQVKQAVADGLQVVAAVPPAASACPYWELDWRCPTLLLLGAEGPGLSQELLALATHRVCIPHSSAVESLNVAVAAAPLLLERWRQERMPHN